MGMLWRAIPPLQRMGQMRGNAKGLRDGSLWTTGYTGSTAVIELK